MAAKGGSADSQHAPRRRGRPGVEAGQMAARPLIALQGSVDAPRGRKKVNLMDVVTSTNAQRGRSIPLEGDRLSFALVDVRRRLHGACGYGRRRGHRRLPLGLVAALVPFIGHLRPPQPWPVCWPGPCAILPGYWPPIRRDGGEKGAGGCGDGGLSRFS